MGLTRHSWAAVLVVLIVALTCSAPPAKAQGKGEDLGTGDTAGKSIYLVNEMRTLHSQLKPELAGVHPRVYFTDAELNVLRARAHGEDAAWWRISNWLRCARCRRRRRLRRQKEARQNDVALAMAEAAFAYRIEGDPRYLTAAKQYMDAAVSYTIWGYSWSKPNVDLTAGHLLYSMGLAYDLLYDDLTPAERDKYRACIVRHGDLLYKAFEPKPGRTWTYSQNHTFIPIAGLGVAAYAVYGEAPEAEKWAELARAYLQPRSVTYSRDGYYYEGFEYWAFATPWLIHYLDALKHATGEDLFDQPGLRNAHLYAAHSLLPGGEMMFDFGDVFDGPISRARKGEDYERSHPGGHLESNYNLLYDLAARFHDAQIQGVADWMRSLGNVSQEEWWTLAWRDLKLASEPMNQVQPWHWFRDHDVVYWRSGWGADATAVALKCGPAEGHAAARLMQELPDWRMEAGHDHPDVNSFIVWAHGTYLTGASGYAGVPKTNGDNTLLVDGHGQGVEGNDHNAWAGFPYDRQNLAHIVKAEFSARGFDLVGEGAGAYGDSLGLTRYQRELKMSSAGHITVQDRIESSKPNLYSEVLHADKAITERGTRAFTLQGFGGSMRAELVKPKEVAQTIEDNVVMGPGIPGSVQNGTLETRGQRVVVTTKAPLLSEQFLWELFF